MPIESVHNAHLFLNWGDQKQYYITERSKLYLECHNFTWFHNRPLIKSPTFHVVSTSWKPTLHVMGPKLILECPPAPSKLVVRYEKLPIEPVFISVKLTFFLATVANMRRLAKDLLEWTGEPCLKFYWRKRKSCLESFIQLLIHYTLWVLSSIIMIFKYKTFNCVPWGFYFLSDMYQTHTIGNCEEQIW